MEHPRKTPTDSQAAKHRSLYGRAAECIPPASITARSRPNLDTLHADSLAAQTIHNRSR